MRVHETIAGTQGVLPAELVSFERIADAGHSVINDQPEVALRILREFIAS